MVIDWEAVILSGLWDGNDDRELPGRREVTNA